MTTTKLLKAGEATIFLICNKTFLMNRHLDTTVKLSLVKLNYFFSTFLFTDHTLTQEKMKEG